jgi:hypothetical protein
MQCRVAPFPRRRAPGAHAWSVTLTVMALHTNASWKRKGSKKKQWDLREAALAAVILASGVWMIIAGLPKLWDE